MNIEQVEILGVPVDCVDMQTAVAWADDVIAGEAQAQTVVAINPEKIVAAQQDVELLDLLKDAGLYIPDGIGAVIAARLKGAKNISRVPGAELMPALCEMAAKQGYGVYLFGASEEVNANAARRLVASFPGLNIAGRRNGYLEAKEYPELIAAINASGAQLLFVGMGSPRQERWMSEYKSQLNSVKICQGVGGTLDVLAGNVKRAPSFFRALNLEWAYRLFTQPTRARRQLALPIFVYRFLLSRMRGLFRKSYKW